MTPDRWDEIQALFVEVVDLEPGARESRLAVISESDPELHSEVLSLLSAHGRAEEVLDPLEDLPSPAGQVEDARPRETVSDPHGLVGRTVSHYEVLEPLGAGGMGVLYRAIDRQLDRIVALKFLPPQWSLDPGFKERFSREARSAAALEHNHVCNVHEIGETGEGQLFIAMAHYEGETVKQKLARGPLEIDEALDLARQAASGLAAAHSQGIVHRDIKPANLMVTDEGVLKILDFGLAKTAETALTETGMRLGTPAYMSPEQTRGEEITPATDLWSLGVVLYEMLTGQRPFRADNDRAVISAIRHEEPTAPGKLRDGLPPNVDEMALQLLSKEPAAREAGAEWLLLKRARSGLEQLLGEVHRRSLWQVLVGWGIGGYVVYALAETLGDRIGLPLWFGRGVLLVLLTVLALFLLTGVVRGRRKPALGTLGPLWLTWRNAVIASTLGFVLLGLATTAYLGMRALGIGPAGTAIAKDQLEPQSWIVLADFASAPEDSALARTVTAAFRIDFSQSPSVRLASPSRVGEIMARMERPARGGLDVETAREVAIRGGIPVVIGGEFRRLGEGFVLTAQLLSPSEKRRGLTMSPGPKRLLAESQATAASEDELMAAIDRLSKGLRERIGEPLRSLRGSQGLPPLTTSSVAALDKYLEGIRSGGGSIELLEEAVALDSSFAEAWRKLGVALVNSGQERSRQVQAFTRAYEHRDRATDRERYLIEATYYRRVTAEYAEAIEAAQSYLARYPDDPPDNSFTAWFGTAIRQHMAQAYMELRRYDRAEEVLVSQLRDFPVSACSSPSNVLSMTLLDLGTLDEARRYADGQLRRCVDEDHDSGPLVYTRAGLIAGVLGDYDAAEEFQAALDAGADDISGQAQGGERLSALYAVWGRLGYARERGREAMAAYERRGLAADYLRVAVGGAAREAFLTGGNRRILPVVEAELVRFPLSGLHPLDRPYLPLATLYAQAGRTDAARRLLTEFESEIEPKLQGPFALEHGRARGELALAEGRYSDAVAEFRASDVGPCNVCALPGLARAYDAAGMPDSAIAVFQRYVETPSSLRVGGISRTSVDDTYLGPSLDRLAQLYDGRAAKDQAATYYARFAQLWKNADPELQPRVEAARARLAELPPPPVRAPTTGTVRVTTSSPGENLDLSAYLVTVGEDERSIELDDATIFRFRSVGDHSVRLHDLADNCAVLGDANRQVTVTGGATAEVAFEVSCAALPPAGVDVTGTWRGEYEGLAIPWKRRFAGTVTYALEQDGDDVTAEITYDDPTWPGHPSTYYASGRVSGRTLTLFYLGNNNPLRSGPNRITATLDVSADEMTGAEEEQQEVWEATMKVKRQ